MKKENLKSLQEVQELFQSEQFAKIQVSLRELSSHFSKISEIIKGNNFISPEISDLSKSMETVFKSIKVPHIDTGTVLCSGWQPNTYKVDYEALNTHIQSQRTKMQIFICAN